MEENNVNSAEPMNAATISEGNVYGGTEYSKDTNVNTNNSTSTNSGTRKTYASGVPAKVSIWTKIKQFLCQDITVELTPKQEKAFKEVYDFWHSDIGTKKFWLQDIEITL